MDEELKKLIHTLGSVVEEQELLNHLSKDKLTQNHIRISRFRNVNAGKNNGSNSRNNGVLKEIILNNISENSTLENNKLK